MEDEQKSILDKDGKVKSFKDIKISTKTVIGKSNLKIDLDNFFRYMPITDYTVVEKKRGRKRRVQIPIVANNVPIGSIISIQKKKDLRGSCLKKPSGGENKYFLHSVTLVIILENQKGINVKVSANGKFQITGCKCDEHFIQITKIIFETMKQTQKWTGEQIFTMDGDQLQVVFFVVMQNMDFNIGFKISRQDLDTFINANTEYCSIYEGSISAGVSIKVKANEDQSDEQFLRIAYDPQTKEIKTSFDSLEEYNKNNPKIERKKPPHKKHRYFTFLVFSTGSIIISGRGKQMEEVFHDIVNILLTNRKHFEKEPSIKSKVQDFVSDRYPNLVNDYYAEALESIDDQYWINYKDWHLQEYPELDITIDKLGEWKKWFGLSPDQDLDQLREEYEERCCKEEEYLNELELKEEY